MDNNIRIYPASIIQEQFWLIQQIHPDSSTYNSFSLFKIRGNLNIKALEKSFIMLLQQHELLRSNFISESGELLQVVQPFISFELFLDDQSALPIHSRERLMREEINTIVQQPFDLSNDLLLRVRLYKEHDKSYVLVLVMHHIVTDLHSREVLAAQLSVLYDQYNDVRLSCGLRGHPSQYSDFSRWQHAFLHSEKYKLNLSHWEKNLAGVSHYLNLPIDKPRPIIQDLSGGAVFFSFSLEESKSIKQLSRHLCGNTFLICLAAYVVLLYRFSRQQEFVIGVPLSNRRNKDYKDTVGCFVNILPLVITISDNGISFVGLVKQVRMILLEAHRNQEVPYELLVKKLQPERDPSYNPLFQVGFAFEPPMQLSLGDLDVVSEKVHNHGSQLDVFANLWVQDGVMHGMFEYDADLFDSATMERYVSHYKTLLRGILQDSEQPISRLPILPENEREFILNRWNSTSKTFHESHCLHQLFEEQVDIQSDALACVFEDTQLTYGQLDQRANRLAHYMRDKNISCGDNVAVYLERSLDMLVAVLAILKSGAAYVPLDPDFPADRIAYMLENSEAKAVICTRVNGAELPPYAGIIIEIDSQWSELEDLCPDRLDSVASADDLAYVIYTSGSTGKPKGVQVHHQAVVNFITSMAESPGFNKNDTLLAVTTLSFDISVLELFLPLSVGGQVVIASQKSVADGQQLKAMVAAHHITVMQATPITWYLLIAAGWEKKNNFKALCGGEPMPVDLANGLLSRSSSVWNLYGPTETTIWSTCYQLKENDKAVYIGRPIANTQIYIVDQYGQPTPIGVAGELLIGGTGVTKGYLGRPNLTAEKFTPDYFADGTKGKLYHTGDMATYMPDGRIKLYGRVDQQVKLRGYRIELGEIEVVLQSCSDVAQVAVIVKDFGGGDQRLVAYYTRQEQARSVADYKAVLQSTLPHYMIPSFFVHLERMPLTVNGKIDRALLPAPAQTSSVVGQNYVPATNRIEEDLCAIWIEVLRLERVGVDDNFFDLGGNSLLCLQVLVGIEKRFQVKVPTVKFFQYPTILSFANFLAQGNSVNENDVLQKQAILRRKVLAARKRRNLQGGA